MTAGLKITMGAMCPTITQQLGEQGLENVGAFQTEFLDRLADAVTLLHLRGVLTDSESDKARNRIMKKLKVRAKQT